MIFEELNVKKELVQGLKEMGLKEPTEIQTKAIPLIKQGKDVISISKTGSGKTAAFGVPILEDIKQGQGIQYLIIAPVRELAVQISNELRKFGKYIKFSVTTVYGGVSINPQIEAMQRADIVVSTPGRLLDHLENYDLKLDKIKCVVLDEADKMVEMGFIEDIRKILNETPNNRQTLLFGATISNEIDELKQEYMHNPVVAQAESHVEEEYLEQYYYDVKQFEKFSLLVHLLKKEKKDLAIVFCSARSTVEMVTKNLRDNGIKADMIHGKLTQNRRLKVIENFHKGRPNILVASAVAARGLDIKDVSHIFNYDLSQDSQEYVHRVGRTARAGKQGKAITLLSERDHDVFREILNRYPVKVEQLPLENFERLRFNSGRRFGGRGSFRGGGRPGGKFGNRGPSRGDQENRSRYGERSSDRPRSGFHGRPRAPEHRPRSPGGRRSSSRGRSFGHSSPGRPKFPRRRY
ncbi:MAG: DEAD/DEAH box helicase [Candidatus Woesearchaeota archaeon]|nr:DEAD/DEAH box helicase [Candidatus Woesearchaeota archaeon]